MSVLSYHVYHRINPHVGMPDAEFAELVDDWIVTHIDHEGMAGMDPDRFEFAVNDLREAVITEHRDARQLYIDMRF